MKSLTPPQRLRLAHELTLHLKAKPVRRVWIPKPGTEEQRPLGIPVMDDRAAQGLAKLALEPAWEAIFEPNSYGFRPGRSCHDAIEAIHASINQQDKYVLDADIAKCFDRIDHQALLAKLNTFPALRRTIHTWLKAGVMEGAQLFPTEAGAPQGGVRSPLRANVALHGLETAIETAFPTYKDRQRWKPRVVRYADDVRHITGHQIPFPERRGSEEKTPGSTAYLKAKARGNSSMPLKRGRSEGVYGLAPQDPRDRVRAILPKPQSPAMEAYIP